jgi:diguanylate cyclase (GGDEF)-like protein/PAS domain S-box-containing protein
MTSVRGASGGRPTGRVSDPEQALVPAPSAVEVQARLTEAEETLRAIRNGEVDALVVQDASPAAQVFTLSSADRPYRMFVENMRDGAATVSESGIILYANRRLADLLMYRLPHVMGSQITSFIASDDHAALKAISGRAQAGGTIEAELVARDGARIPVRINSSTLDVDSHELLCLTFADLTEQRAQGREIDRLGHAQAERMRELELAQEALTLQATHDALTGLPNRKLIIDRLTQGLALAKRLQTSIGLIFVDLDNFKAINDTGGHAAGDAVLREVADRLVTAVRPMDSVSRLGGDEFVVVLPGLESPAQAIAVGRRIAASVDVPIMLSHRTMTVSASIGISVANPAIAESGVDPDTLLRQADSAMYHAKSLGGARTQLFNIGTPSVVAADRDKWIARIRRALDEDRFVLHGQPIVDLATGRVVQHELLLRMRGDSDDLILPLSFLPVAEKSGLIAEIDQWVITQATKIAAQGRPVGVNLSASCAGDPRMLDLIEAELSHHATDPGNIVFEITETAVMQNMDRATRFVEQLVSLGCNFALDDFGTGFASFTYLKMLPVRYLKIDVDFVRDVARSKRDMFVVRAIVALAGDFGQQTIAEGVEDEATATVLRDLGVTYAQGFLYGRPRPLIGGTPSSLSDAAPPGTPPDDSARGATSSTTGP